MTREELIKKIAKVIESDDYSEDIEPGSGKRWTWWRGEAKAAIDIVLEEVERRTDIASLGCSKDAADRIRSTIRELKG